MEISILIVDDSSVMRLMIVKTIQLSGIPVREIYQAANGQEGLNTLNQRRIDLVIADINMPVMSGEEMIDKMCDDVNISNIPVIVVSSEGSEKRIDRLKSKGVKFIQKPFSPEEIRNTINTIRENAAK